jgi:hypothetical protein
MVSTNLEVLAYFAGYCCGGCHHHDSLSPDEPTDRPKHDDRCQMVDWSFRHLLVPRDLREP